MRVRVVLLLALAALPALIAAAPASADLRAGAARADITPPVGTPMFAYTARSAIAGGHVDRPLQVLADPDTHLYAKSFVPSRGIHTRVQARALVLEREGRRYALVQADLGGVPYALTQEVARRVEPATGIGTGELLISATHTHASTGPIWPADNLGYAALGGDAFDPRAFEVTAQGIAEAILRAHAALAPARLGTATVALRGASRNRAFEMFRRNEDVPADEAAAREASIDPDLSVVRVDDRRGRPVAVWSNFAIHATSFGDGNLLFSGDNPGIAEELVEEELSRRSRGRDVVNVWTNGNEGDISPHGDADRVGDEPAQYDASAFAKAHLAGARVAEGVLGAWRAAGERMTDAPALGVRRSFLGFDGTPADGEPVGPHQVLGAGVVSEGMCAPVDNLAGPGQGRKFPGLTGVGLVPSVVPVAMWRVGPLGVVALPSEVTKQMGQRIRTSLEQQAGGALDRVALAGLSNGYVSYTATPEEYDGCHYEGSFTLFGRRQGARFLDVARQLNGALLAGGDAPAGAPEPPSLGFGTTADTPPRRTPDAGTVTSEPAETAARGERVALSWQGGDPAIDAPRGRPFVTLQRRTGKRWRTVRTDASFRDTTERAEGDVWTHTVQLDACDATGPHRLLVEGVADRGAGPEPYTVASRTFTVAPATLAVDPVVVEDGVARVRARHPDPGEDALLALPRLVRDGAATLRVRTADGGLQTIAAPADPATATYSAAIPAGATVERVTVRDACGNTGTA